MGGAIKGWELVLGAAHLGNFRKMSVDRGTYTIR